METFTLKNSKHIVDNQGRLIEIIDEDGFYVRFEYFETVDLNVASKLLPTSLNDSYSLDGAYTRWVIKTYPDGAEFVRMI